MGYETALGKAWDGVEKAGLSRVEAVRFFTDEFSADPQTRTVYGVSGTPAKDFVSILVLHYLEKKLRGLPPLSNRWISFKELESGESYYPAFRKRSIDLLVKKYGSDPRGIASILEKQVSARRAGPGDEGVVVEAFKGVPVQVVLWRGDDEFPPEANILFDASIGLIFCTEDAAVLAGFIPKYV